MYYYCNEFGQPVREEFYTPLIQNNTGVHVLLIYGGKFHNFLPDSGEHLREEWKGEYRGKTIQAYFPGRSGKGCSIYLFGDYYNGSPSPFNQKSGSTIFLSEILKHNKCKIPPIEES